MIYSSDFLKNICKRLGIDDAEEKIRFSQFIVSAGEEYSQLKYLNPKNPDIRPQKRLLKQYHNAITKAQDLYAKIQKDRICEGRLSISLRSEYNELSMGTKKKLSPYINDTGRFEPLFAHSLELHIIASEGAIYLASSKNPEKEILLRWLIAYKKNWPKRIKIKFGLGDYMVKGSEYKSVCRDILYDLIVKIDPKISKTYIASLMREV